MEAAKEAAEEATGKIRLVEPNYTKFLVNLDNDMIQRMITFEDEETRREFVGRLTGGMTTKSGKKIHLDSLHFLKAEEKFLEYISGIGFDWLLGTQVPDVPEILAQEFFTSFRFKNTTDLQKRSISFRFFGTEIRMNLTEWSVRLGLFSEEQAEAGAWTEREIGKPKAFRDFDPHAVWRSITHSKAPPFQSDQAGGFHIKIPVLRLAQVFLGYNLLGKANLTAPVTMVELYFMWCMKEQKKVHLGYWLAHVCHAIAIHPNLPLHTCHILGEFVRRNCQIHPAAGLPQLPKCPAPEDLDLNLLIRLKFLKVVDKEMRFYIEGGYKRSAVGDNSKGRVESSDGRDDGQTSRNSVVTREAMEEQKRLTEAQTSQIVMAVGSLERSISRMMERLPLQHEQRQKQSSLLPHEERRTTERPSGSFRGRHERRPSPPPPRRK
ncbi:hypothetical protein AAHA92_09853 [Salvia divinorum]|uniref:Aminotransferase-like plant mobile domain-containing protein n=1 Tax=Salvia divinorum TaxID=28513 RepID=A0ABD1HVE6_SALDI